MVGPEGVLCEVQVTVVATEALLPESLVQRCLADRVIGCFLKL